MWKYQFVYSDDYHRRQHSSNVNLSGNTVAECNDDLTPTGQGMATATDNCDMSPAISSSDAITAGLCDETYTITRTWTVVDECGNSTSCEQTIDVQDTTEPTFNQVLPGDETVNCQSVPAPPAPITGSDNCDAVVDIDFVEVSTQGVDPTQCTYYNYNVTRTWTATDNCGNEAIHTQVITVEDVTGPTFTAPADLVAADMLSCGDEEDLNVTGFPTNIMDNCAPDEADGSDGYMTGAMSWTTAMDTRYPLWMSKRNHLLNVHFRAMVCTSVNIRSSGPGQLRTHATMLLLRYKP